MNILFFLQSYGVIKIIFSYFVITEVIKLIKNLLHRNKVCIYRFIPAIQIALKNQPKLFKFVLFVLIIKASDVNGFADLC